MTYKICWLALQKDIRMFYKSDRMNCFFSLIFIKQSEQWLHMAELLQTREDLNPVISVLS